MEAKNKGFTGTTTDYIQITDYIALQKQTQQREESMIRKKVDERYVYKEIRVVKEMEDDWLRVMREQLQNKEIKEIKELTEKKESTIAREVECILIF